VTVSTDVKYDLKGSLEQGIKQYGADPMVLIMILQDIQKRYGYLPAEVLQDVAKAMKLPLAQVYGVVTFYRSFRLKPNGKKHVCVCVGTSCHVRQSGVILDKLEQELHIKAGQTTPDGEYSLGTASCLGACAVGPVVVAGGEFGSRMTTPKVDEMLAELRKRPAKASKAEEAA
jgi:NADH-quinone oxidoreductase subunit E